MRAGERPAPTSRPRIQHMGRLLPSTRYDRGCRRPTASATARIRHGERRGGPRRRRAGHGYGRQAATATGDRRATATGDRRPSPDVTVGDREIAGYRRKKAEGADSEREPNTLRLCSRARPLSGDSGPLRDAGRPVPAHRRPPAFGATHASRNHAERRPAAHRASLRGARPGSPPAFLLRLPDSAFARYRADTSGRSVKRALTCPPDGSRRGRRHHLAVQSGA
jgi:hypothetical protein